MSTMRDAEIPRLQESAGLHPGAESCPLGRVQAADAVGPARSAGCRCRAINFLSEAVTLARTCSARRGSSRADDVPAMNAATNRRTVERGGVAASRFMLATSTSSS